MDIFQQISDAIHDFLVNLVGGVFIQIFDEEQDRSQHRYGSRPLIGTAIYSR